MDKLRKLKKVKLITYVQLEGLNLSVLFYILFRISLFFIQIKFQEKYFSFLIKLSNTVLLFYVFL
jgi:hypothetical protein